VNDIKEKDKIFKNSLNIDEQDSFKSIFSEDFPSESKYNSYIPNFIEKEKIGFFFFFKKIEINLDVPEKPKPRVKIDDERLKKNLPILPNPKSCNDFDNNNILLKNDEIINKKKVIFFIKYLKKNKKIGKLKLFKGKN
jgi:hypothetical protein